MVHSVPWIANIFENLWKKWNSTDMILRGLEKMIDENLKSKSLDKVPLREFWIRYTLNLFKFIFHENYWSRPRIAIENIGCPNPYSDKTNLQTNLHLWERWVQHLEVNLFDVAQYLAYLKINLELLYSDSPKKTNFSNKRLFSHYLPKKAMLLRFSF